MGTAASLSVSGVLTTIAWVDSSLQIPSDESALTAQKDGLRALRDKKLVGIRSTDFDSNAENNALTARPTRHRRKIRTERRPGIRRLSRYFSWREKSDEEGGTMVSRPR